MEATPTTTTQTISTTSDDTKRQNKKRKKTKKEPIPIQSRVRGYGGNNMARESVWIAINNNPDFATQFQFYWEEHIEGFKKRRKFKSKGDDDDNKMEWQIRLEMKKKQEEQKQQPQQQKDLATASLDQARIEAQNRYREIKQQREKQKEGKPSKKQPNVTLSRVIGPPSKKFDSRKVGPR